MSYDVPLQLVQKISDLAKVHTPPAKRGKMYEYIIKLGLERIGENGPERMDNLIGREDGVKVQTDRFVHFIRATTFFEFEKMYKEQFSMSSKTVFHEYLVNLGIRAYEEMYDEFGVRRD
jgi:hypothetical protein